MKMILQMTLIATCLLGASANAAWHSSDGSITLDVKNVVSRSPDNVMVTLTLDGSTHTFPAMESESDDSECGGSNLEANWGQNSISIEHKWKPIGRGGECAETATFTYADGTTVALFDDGK